MRDHYKIPELFARMAVITRRIQRRLGRRLGLISETAEAISPEFLLADQYLYFCELIRNQTPDRVAALGNEDSVMWLQNSSDYIDAIFSVTSGFFQNTVAIDSQEDYVAALAAFMPVYSDLVRL